MRRYQSRKCVVGWDEFVAWRAERGFPVELDDDDCYDEEGAGAGIF